MSQQPHVLMRAAYRSTAVVKLLWISPGNYSLLRLPEHTQVPTFYCGPQIKTVEPVSPLRGRRSWGGQTMVRRSAIVRHSVRAGDEK